MLLSDLKPNPTNPRKIRESKLNKLIEALRAFPGMMKIRPMVADRNDNNKILGGNMRHLALTKLGYTDIPDDWVRWVDELTSEEKEQFILLDNTEFGEWDYDLLADLNTEHLAIADIQLPSGISQEIEIDRFEVKYNIIIECTGEAHQAETLEKLEKEGYVCRPLML